MVQLKICLSIPSFSIIHLCQQMYCVLYLYHCHCLPLISSCVKHLIQSLGSPPILVRKNKVGTTN